MTNNTINTFLKDLCDLYCKTGNKNIERLFVSAAQSFDAQFKRWVQKNPVIKTELPNPDVYDALMLLYHIQDMYPSDVSLPMLMKIFTGTKDAKYLPAIIGIAKNMDDPSISDVVAPFRSILSIISSAPFSTEAVGGIASSVMAMKDGFNEFLEGSYKPKKSDKETFRRKSRVEKLADLFGFLLRRISSDISTVAIKNGYPQVADKINAGIMANPLAMSSLIPWNGNDPFKMKFVTGLINEAISMEKKEMGHEFIYNYCLTQILRFYSIVDEKEVRNYYAEYLMGVDYSGYMGENGAGEKSKQTKFNVSDAALMNPRFLNTFSIFLATLLNKIKSMRR